MATTYHPGHITKKQAAERYKRHYRNIGKDMAVAFATRDEEFLKHIQLRTNDGKRRYGTDIDDPDSVTGLKKDGLAPMWYFDTTYFDTKYKYRRDDDDSDRDVSDNTSPPITDAEIIESYDDDEDPQDEEGALALFRDPLVQMQARRISELESDRESDKQTILTLREAIQVFLQQAQAQDGKTAGDTKTSTDLAGKQEPDGESATTKSDDDRSGKDSRNKKPEKGTEKPKPRTRTKRATSTKKKPRATKDPRKTTEKRKQPEKKPKKAPEPKKKGFLNRIFFG